MTNKKIIAGSSHGLPRDESRVEQLWRTACSCWTGKYDDDDDADDDDDDDGDDDDDNDDDDDGDDVDDDDDNDRESLCIRCVLGEIKSSQGRNCARGVCRIQNLPGERRASSQDDDDDNDDNDDEDNDDDDDMR